MPEYFVTFPCGLVHCDAWVRIGAEDEGIARRAAYEHFGNKWSMIYERSDFKSGFFPMGELFAFRVLDEHLNYERILVPGEAA